MLERFNEQLKAKYTEIQKTKDAREELKEYIRQSYEELKEHIEQFASESAASEIEIKEIDYEIEQMYEEAKRIYADIDSLQGT